MKAVFRRHDVIIYFRSEVIGKNSRKYRLRRLRVEFLENGLSQDHEVLYGLSRATGPTNMPETTSLAASGRHLSRFEKRRKMPHPTALFALSITHCCIMQCQRRLQISRVTKSITCEIKAAWRFAQPHLMVGFLSATANDRTTNDGGRGGHGINATNWFSQENATPIKFVIDNAKQFNFAKFPWLGHYFHTVAQLYSVFINPHILNFFPKRYT